MNRGVVLLFSSVVACGAATAVTPHEVADVRDASAPPLDASDSATSLVDASRVADAVALDASEPTPVCVNPRWRIDFVQTGPGGIAPGRTTRIVFCDDGSYTSDGLTTHGSASDLHDAQALLAEMKQHGQLVTSSPPQPALGCGSMCPTGEIRVTFDGAEYFVNLAAKDPKDPPPIEQAMIGHGASADWPKYWPNQRARRLEAVLARIAANVQSAREGKVTVSGKLPADVVGRIVRQNMGRSRQCYRDALRTDATLAGAVTVKLVIDRTGKVSFAIQEPGSHATDIADPAMVSCVVHGFGTLSFPQPQEAPVIVVYQTVFTP